MIHIVEGLMAERGTAKAHLAQDYRELPLNMAGHSGSPKISGRVFRVFKISGFQNCYPKFVLNNQNPTFRVPENSGSGSDNPKLPDFNKLIARRSKSRRFSK